MCVLLLAAGMLTGCSAPGTGTEESLSERAEVTESEESPEKTEFQLEKDYSEKQGETMRLYVNEEELSVFWEDNESVDALRNRVTKEALTIEMSVYGDFEQVGSIGLELPANDSYMTTDAGDIVLYSGDQIVLFYGSNTWNYTKLGHVENVTDQELKQMLGTGPVTLTIRMDQQN